MLKFALLALGTSVATLASGAAHALSSPLADKLAQQPGISCRPAPNGDICTLRTGIHSETPTLHYSQPIAILIPPNVSHPSDLVLHFHGFRGVCESNSATPAQMANNFEMLSQMKNAGATNSVMILPMSKGKETTFNQELVPQFEAFTSYMTQLTEPVANNHWIISGHSGAFQPIGAILAKASPSFVKRLDSVILLDSTYTQRSGWFQSFERAAAINHKMDVYSTWRAGGGTEAGTRELKTSLPQNHVEIARSSTSSHCHVPNLYLGPALQKTIARHTPANAPQLRHAQVVRYVHATE
jgi:hypothetical protein